jgi:hypothetical protein
MEPPIHNLPSLFKQLGLDDSDEAIEQFIADHKPLPAAVELHEADCWNSAQAAFLRQEKEEDADWAEIVDQLDAMLR